jgi:3-hydroxy-D-aspartate aldolase
MTIPPAQVGMRVEEVDTPALIVDLDAYERNLDRMVSSLGGSSVRLRPHAKTHKCPIITHHQVSRGAVGACCQKVGEAEVLIADGVRDVLVTNQIVTPGKIARLVALAKKAVVSVCVDDAENVRDLDAAAGPVGVRLPVLVEVDIGPHRCGVDPGEPAVALAKLVDSSRHLRFAGLHAYHGKAQHIYALEDRINAMEAAIGLTAETIRLLKEAGLECEVVTGGGTGTYQIEAASGVFNEVQPGSYIFMDVDYKRVEGFPSTFENALFVIATVMSRGKEHAVCDAGLKASSIDSGLPTVWDRPGLAYLKPSDEHGSLRSTDSTPLPRIGDRIWLVPGHVDPTVNLYDWFVCVRGGYVEAMWPILARGALR